MTVQTSWMFVAGFVIIGWFVPELFRLSSRVRNIPIGMNLMAAIVFGLIAGSFV